MIAKAVAYLTEKMTSDERRAQAEQNRQDAAAKKAAEANKAEAK